MRPSSADRPATGSAGGGPEGKLRGRPPPPHCLVPDLGDGRGLNPSPDEREPAGRSITQGPRQRLRLLKVVNIVSRFRLGNEATDRLGTQATGRLRWLFGLGSTA